MTERGFNLENSSRICLQYGAYLTHLQGFSENAVCVAAILRSVAVHSRFEVNSACAAHPAIQTARQRLPAPRNDQKRRRWVSNCDPQTISKPLKPLVKIVLKRDFGMFYAQ